MLLNKQVFFSVFSAYFHVIFFMQYDQNKVSFHFQFVFSFLICVFVFDLCFRFLFVLLFSICVFVFDLCFRF